MPTQYVALCTQEGATHFPGHNISVRWLSQFQLYSLVWDLLYLPNYFTILGSNIFRASEVMDKYQ